MKIVSWVVAALGLLMVLVSVVGRFHGPPTVTLLGSTHFASSVLLVGNTLLLAAIFLAVACPPPKP
jgi:hypothetical protein